MNKRTKIILSAIGIAAVIVPALLLLVATSRTKNVPPVQSGERQIDVKNVQDSAKMFQPSKAPAPSPATSSATPQESTNSGAKQ